MKLPDERVARVLPDPGTIEIVVGGGGFTSMTSAGSVQRVAVNADKLGRYLRLNMDIGGTNSPKFTLGAGIYGDVQG